MAYQGDFLPGALIDLLFLSASAGIPTALSGSPAIAVYRAGSTTEITAGVTLTTNYDGRTGLNHITVDTTQTGYTVGSDYTLVLTAGTVGGSSAANYTVASFSIANRGYLQVGTAQDGDTDTITLANGSAALSPGNLISIIRGSGAGQTRTIDDYDGGDPTLPLVTVDRAWDTGSNPDNTSIYSIIRSNSPALNSALEVTADSTGVAQAVDDELSSAHGPGSWQQANIVLPGNSGGTVAFGSANKNFAAVGNNVVFEDSIILSVPAAAWQSGDEITFTIKSNVKTQTDDQADLTIKVTNPADGTHDGLIRYLGAAPSSSPSRTDASLSVTYTETDAVAHTGTLLVKWHIEAAAMGLTDGTTYTYEIDNWRSTSKYFLGGGLIPIVQTVRKTITAP